MGKQKYLSLLKSAFFCLWDFRDRQMENQNLKLSVFCRLKLSIKPESAIETNIEKSRDNKTKNEFCVLIKKRTKFSRS